MLSIDPTPSAALDLEELARRFQDEQRAVELSPDTIRSYEIPLRQFRHYMGEHGVTTTTQLTRPLLSAWQESLKSREIDATTRNARRHLAPATRSIYSIAIRQMLTYAAREDLVDLSLTLAIRRVKVHRGLPRPIPAADLARIAPYLDRKCKGGKLVWLRTRALFWYLVTSGARISEALQMERQEAARLVATDSGAVRVTRKGGHEGLLLCPPAAVAMIREYIEARRDRSPWLWVGHLTGGWCYVSGKPPGLLTIQAANEKWRRVAESAHVKVFTSHQCRHTTATEMLAAGITHMVIAEHLGHADLRQLSTYAQVNIHARQTAVDAMDKLVKHHRPPKAPKTAPVSTPPPVVPEVATAPEPVKPSPSIRLPVVDEDAWADISGAL